MALTVLLLLIVEKKPRIQFVIKGTFCPITKCSSTICPWTIICLRIGDWTARNRTAGTGQLGMGQLRIGQQEQDSWGWDS
jgi:hypothetical protein